MSAVQPAPDLAEFTTDDLQYKTASTTAERSAAFRLVYEAYLRAGLIEPNLCRLRVTPFHLLPTTETLVAVCNGTVVSTVSLVLDGELGLPMEAIFGPEISARRRQGRVLGEVSCLADRRHESRRLFPVFLRLCRLAAQYARRRGVDELLVAVHPKHARFYQRFMAFQGVGEETEYPSVRNNPAVALSYDFARVERHHADIHKMFFGEPIPEEQIRSRPMTPGQVEYFRPIVESVFGPTCPDKVASGPQMEDFQRALVVA